MMPTATLYLVLALRIALAWWLVLVAFAALFSGALTVHGGWVLLPPLALLMGGAAAWRQRRADIGRDGSASPLLVGAGQVLHLALPGAQALRLAESAIKAAFDPETSRRTDTAVMARVSDPGLHRAGLGPLRANALSASVSSDGSTRSQLLITCAPVHAWLYGVFWVDGRRCARHVAALREAVLARVRELEHAADEHHRRQALQARLTEAELSLLRAQVEPNFLLNTLAHIRSSLGPGAEVPRQMLDALIDFLRADSDGFSQAGTALSDELRRVEGYLRLMQLRLGPRLVHQITCSPALASVEVPTACVLVLAENAIKHGIERRVLRGEISIRCHAAASALVIHVDNDGPGLATASAVSQGGLHNLRERLHLAYAGDAQMTVEERAEGGVRASLRLPLAMTGD